MKKRFLAGTAAALAVLTLAGCSSTPTVAEIVLETPGMSFSNKKVQVKQGQPVKLTLQNKDGVVHDFTIAKMPVKDLKEQTSSGHTGGHGDSKDKVHVSAAGGKSGIIEFTPTAKGTYTFICTEPGHKESGMEGQLIVE